MFSKKEEQGDKEVCEGITIAAPQLRCQPCPGQKPCSFFILGDVGCQVLPTSGKLVFVFWLSLSEAGSQAGLQLFHLLRVLLQLP